MIQEYCIRYLVVLKDRAIMKFSQLTFPGFFFSFFFFLVYVPK